jgi:superoxide dismutase, Cu-Zn family
MAGKYHLLAAVAVGACATALSAAVADRLTATTETAALKDPTGKPVGSVRVETAGGKTKITVRASDLPPGYHGIHIHTKGVCDPNAKDPATGSPFFSAGPHFDLDHRSHPAHTGDLPDLLVTGDGRGVAEVTTDRFRPDQLLDADGSAVIIHAAPDNQANIPNRYTKSGPDAETRKTGDSGARIACGVIARH